jgi:hypothetical protein
MTCIRYHCQRLLLLLFVGWLPLATASDPASEKSQPDPAVVAETAAAGSPELATSTRR